MEIFNSIFQKCSSNYVIIYIFTLVDNNENVTILTEIEPPYEGELDDRLESSVPNSIERSVALAIACSIASSKRYC